MRKWLLASISLNVLFITVFLVSFQSEKNAEPRIVVEHKLYDNIYLRARNEINIAVEGISAENIILKTPQANIESEQIGPGQFLVKPLARKKDGCKLKVYERIGDSTKFIGTRTMRTMKLPTPYIGLGGLNDPHQGGTISQNLAMAKITVQVDYAPEFLDIRYDVTEFNLIIASNRYGKIEHVAYGNSPTLKMRNDLRKIEHGDKVIIPYAKAVSPVTDTILVSGPLIMEIDTTYGGW